MCNCVFVEMRVLTAHRAAGYKMRPLLRVTSPVLRDSVGRQKILECSCLGLGAKNKKPKIVYFN